MSTRQQRSRQILDAFRQRQQEAASEQEQTSRHQKKTKKTINHHLPRMIRPRLVAQFALAGEKPRLYYIHRHADNYGQVVISACNRARTYESIELPNNGDDPFWILAQPHDWFVSGVMSLPSCSVQKCYWQGLIHTKPLLYTLERLLPRLDHE